MVNRNIPGWEMLKQENYYDSNAISFEESHLAFKRSLGEGFAWEVLEVYSGPPTVTFSWKHFGRMTDYFSCRGLSGLVYKVDPKNRMIKVFGMCKATINEKYQIQDLQVFYDPSQLLAQLTEISPFAPFMKLPNSHPLPPPLSKKVLEQGETNNEVNGLNRKINIFQHKRKEDYALNPQSTMCIVL